MGNSQASCTPLIAPVSLAISLAEEIRLPFDLFCLLKEIDKAGDFRPKNQRLDRFDDAVYGA